MAVETVACGEPVPLGILEKPTDSAVVAAAEGSGLLACEEYAGRLQIRNEVVRDDHVSPPSRYALQNARGPAAPRVDLVGPRAIVAEHATVELGAENEKGEVLGGELGIVRSRARPERRGPRIPARATA